ncbi:MAG: hypothetical protein ACI3Z7_01565 [Candidatus Aphodosoma sp.]
MAQVSSFVFARRFGCLRIRLVVLSMVVSWFVGRIGVCSWKSTGLSGFNE